MSYSVYYTINNINIILTTIDKELKNCSNAVQMYERIKFINIVYYNNDRVLEPIVTYFNDGLY